MFVNNITVAYGDKRLPSNVPGFPHAVGQDFSEGAGGKYVGVYYSTGDLNAITDIRVTADGDEDRAMEMASKDGYIIVPYDLNLGSGGKFIYISFTTAPAEVAVTKLGAYVSDSEVADKPGDWDRWSKQDCNEGAGGKFIYLLWNVARFPD